MPHINRFLSWLKSFWAFRFVEKETHVPEPLKPINFGHLDEWNWQPNYTPPKEIE